MSLIDRTGTFRGVITDHGIGVTTNELPQWVVQLQALEYYDVDEKIWVDWSGYDERDITAYLVLFSKNDKEIFHSKQIKKVTGWSGKSFAELNDMDLSNVQLQFRVAEHTYEGNTSMQVEAIDEYDATPGRSVNKLEKSELSTLDAKYSNILKSTSGGVTAAKAPAKPKTKPQVPKPDTARLTATQAQTQARAATPPQEAAPPQAPARAAPDMPGGKCTKKEAFNACVSMKDKSVADDVFSQTWVNTINEIVGEKTPDKDVTPEQWFQIKEIVLKKTAAF